jgi:hypothetical protein
VDGNAEWEWALFRCKGSAHYRASLFTTDEEESIRGNCADLELHTRDIEIRQLVGFEICLISC